MPRGYHKDITQDNVDDIIFSDPGEPQKYVFELEELYDSAIDADYVAEPEELDSEEYDSYSDNASVPGRKKLCMVGPIRGGITILQPLLLTLPPLLLSLPSLAILLMTQMTLRLSPLLLLHLL